MGAFLCECWGFGKRPRRLVIENKTNFRERYGKSQAARQSILKRILWLNLGTEAEQKKMLKPAAEKAVEEALKEIKKRLKGFDIELDF